MIPMNQLRKGIVPSPVYHAVFADGSHGRMSYWCESGKALPFDSAKAFVEAIYGQSVRIGAFHAKAANQWHVAEQLSDTDWTAISATGNACIERGRAKLYAEDRAYLVLRIAEAKNALEGAERILARTEKHVADGYMAEHNRMIASSQRDDADKCRAMVQSLEARLADLVAEYETRTIPTASIAQAVDVPKRNKASPLPKAEILAFLRRAAEGIAVQNEAVAMLARLAA